MRLSSPASYLIPVLLTALAACAAPPFDAKAVAMEWAVYMQRDYVVQPGDTLTVAVHPEEDFAQEILVPPTGKVLFARLAEPMQVSGLTMPVLRKELDRAYRKVFTGEIQVQVAMARLGVPTIYVAGEVRRAGALPYAPGMTLVQAVTAAGGLEITAKASDVRILRNVPGQPPRTIRVDLDSIMHDGAPSFFVLPGDVIYCQTSGVADVGNWIDLYIRRMIPLPIQRAIGT